MRMARLSISVMLAGCVAVEHEPYSKNYQDYLNLDPYCATDALKASASQEYNPDSMAQKNRYLRCLEQTKAKVK